MTPFKIPATPPLFRTRGNYSRAANPEDLFEGSESESFDGSIRTPNGPRSNCHQYYSDPTTINGLRRENARVFRSPSSYSLGREQSSNSFSVHEEASDEDPFISHIHRLDNSSSASQRLLTNPCLEYTLRIPRDALPAELQGNRNYPDASKFSSAIKQDTFPARIFEEPQRKTYSHHLRHTSAPAAILGSLPEVRNEVRLVCGPRRTEKAVPKAREVKLGLSSSFNVPNLVEQSSLPRTPTLQSDHTYEISTMGDAGFSRNSSTGSTSIRRVQGDGSSVIDIEESAIDIEEVIVGGQEDPEPASCVTLQTELNTSQTLVNPIIDCHQTTMLTNHIPSASNQPRVSQQPYLHDKRKRRVSRLLLCFGGSSRE